ncbi:MAG: LysM peptidoglycan-binding domain-containing protein [bacterium]
MKKILLLSFAVFCLMGLQGQSVRVYISDSIQARDGKQYYIHQVTQGQTVYSIAKAYDVSVDELYFENPGAKEGINIDQYLWIPTVSRETELTREVRSRKYKFFYHIIKSGDTYSKLSREYNRPLAYILQANNDVPQPLREGQYVRIPVDDAFDKLEELPSGQGADFDSEPAILPGYRHEVIKGETLYSLAKKYRVTIDQLRRVNPGLGPTLEIGDLLRIPEPTAAENTPQDNSEQEEPQEPAYYMHKVQKKETLYSISRLYGVTLQDLYSANEGLSTNIDVGQVIRVPNIKIDKPYIVYTSSSRTRLNRIAKLYNVPLSMLERENPSLSRRILPGQKVRIPVGRKARVTEEEPDTEEETGREEEAVADTTVSPVRKVCDKIRPDFSKTYEVALMIPFYTEELDSLDRMQFMSSPQEGFLPFRFIRFYEGALLAVDSLRSLGFNINLHVYDVDQSIEKTAKILQDPRLQYMDLIIGPFLNRSFDQVALFAGNFNIPIVNPFSFRNEITTKYNSTIKVKPDTDFQAKMLAALIQRDHALSKVFLITHNDLEDIGEVNNIQKEIETVLSPTIEVGNTDLSNLGISIAFRDEDYNSNSPLPDYKFEGSQVSPALLSTEPEDSTSFPNRLIRVNYIKDSLNPFFRNASALRKNLVIIYGDNESFYGDALNKLNEYRDTFNIRVITLPTTERLRYLDELQANNMQLTYFSSHYIDYDDPQVIHFVEKFRRAYHTDPDIYGFSGFDVSYYFIDALVNLDKRMRSCIDEFPADMLLSKYAIRKVGKSGNYVNSYWNILKYHDLSVIKLKDPELPPSQEKE